MALSLTKRRVITALAVWFVTRVLLYLIATGHLLRHYGVESVGDVTTYTKWAEQYLYYGQIPAHDTQWQYPPLLAPILVFPEWLSQTFGLHYLTGFTAMTFLADCVITAMLLWTASRRDTWSGPWYWIVGVPLLGPIVYGRYDVFPALCVVFSLALLGRGVPMLLPDGRSARQLNNRRWVAGVLIGFGAAIKIWPGLAIFGMPRSKRGWQAIATVVASILGSIGILSIFFSNTLSFVKNQGGRGIEIESVWAVPWMIGKRLHLDHVVTNKVVYGSYQIVPDGHGLSSALVGATYYAALAAQVVGFGLMAYWWWRKNWRPAVVADATFVATLVMIVTSRVISPQYLIWLLAVAGFCLLYRDTTQRRSSVLVLICLPLTQFEFPFDFSHLRTAHLVAVLVVALRDLLLVLATYFGFRDLWVSTVDGAFVPPRLRALISRGGASADAASVEATPAVGAQAPAEEVGTAAKAKKAEAENGGKGEKGEERAEP
ncbi:MAG TPA: glycosyltransferase family 87 protein, partial [Actinospica sp.]|nr:glycosyltransferase family 87 protein [Actinospica sp.]